jgi:hypothetical protein
MVFKLGRSPGLQINALFRLPQSILSGSLKENSVLQWRVRSGFSPDSLLPLALTRAPRMFIICYSNYDEFKPIYDIKSIAIRLKNDYTDYAA